MVDCGANPQVPICTGEQDKTCVARCPSQLPFYNDTSSAPGEQPTSPQLCVAACADLGAEAKTVMADDGVHSCSTQDAGGFATFSSSDQTYVCGSMFVLEDGGSGVLV